MVNKVPLIDNECTLFYIILNSALIYIYPAYIQQKKKNVQHCFVAKLLNEGRYNASTTMCRSTTPKSSWFQGFFRAINLTWDQLVSASIDFIITAIYSLFVSSTSILIFINQNTCTMVPWLSITGHNIPFFMDEKKCWLNDSSLMRIQELLQKDCK